MVKFAMFQVKNKTQLLFRSWKNPSYESGSKYLRAAKVVCILFGIVPLVSRKKNKKRSTVSSEILLDQQDDFKISFITRLIWIALAVITIFTFTRNNGSKATAIKSTIYQCFQTNLCYKYVLFVLHSIRPISALVIIVINASKVLLFLERLDAVLKQQVFRADFQNAVGKYLLHIYFVSYSSVYWYHRRKIARRNHFIYYFNIMLPFVLDFFIITILNAIKKCFQNINVEIRQLTKAFEKEKLSALWMLHWELNELIAEIDLCYGMSMLIGLICTVVEVILCVFYLIDVNPRMDNVRRNLTQDVFLLFRIFLLCKKGTEVVLQSNETLVQLERLSRKRARLLNGSEQTAVEVFRGRLKNRKSVISCGGFVNINLDFIMTFVGFVLMYWTVLIQFNDENQKKDLPKT